MKYWEAIADNLSKSGWSWGLCGNCGRARADNRIADTHCGDDISFRRERRAKNRLTSLTFFGRIGTRGMLNSARFVQTS
jgi:hypothetical protein